MCRYVPWQHAGAGSYSDSMSESTAASGAGPDYDRLGWRVWWRPVPRRERVHHRLPWLAAAGFGLVGDCGR
jgi:hypothetical protein